MLLDSFDVWIRQHARGRAYFTIPELKEARLGFMPQPGSLFDQAYNIDLLGAPGEAQCNTMAMRSKLSFDLGMFQRRFSSWEHLPRPSAPGSLSVDDATYLQALLSSHLEVHPGTSIPDDVLSGPFESEDGDVQVGEEKMLRLFWLVRGGSCLQQDQMWEVTRQGFREILQLIKGAEAGTVKDEEATRRVQLAWRLFALFGVLGVYQNQWPKCECFYPTPPPLPATLVPRQNVCNHDGRTDFSRCRHHPNESRTGQDTNPPARGPRARDRHEAAAHHTRQPA